MLGDLGWKKERRKDGWGMRSIYAPEGWIVALGLDSRMKTPEVEV